ncbi:thioredoxin family protein [Joostella sp. CR20]|uniref:thioredoxin family protein n=1 Tax=Joostella sp. CR20 TaxID=2804312 RepID=UPI00313EEFD2
MKNLFLFVFLLAITTTSAQEIEWLTWEQAIEKSATDEQPKKIFVDVYTDWCGWCKKMDKDTFNNPEVAAYMKANFYMVKMDAEGKEDIEYMGKTFKYVGQGKRGYHELAAALLQGKMSFPTVIFLNENVEIISPVPGYQKPDSFLKVAKYFGEEIYKTQDWATYEAQKS